VAALVSATLVATIEPTIDAFALALQAHIDVLTTAIQARIDPFAAGVDMARRARMAVAVQPLCTPISVRCDVITALVQSLLAAVAAAIQMPLHPLAPVSGVGTGGRGKGKCDDKWQCTGHVASSLVG